MIVYDVLRAEKPAFISAQTIEKMSLIENITIDGCPPKIVIIEGCKYVLADDDFDVPTCAPYDEIISRRELESLFDMVF